MGERDRSNDRSRRTKREPAVTRVWCVSYLLARGRLFVSRDRDVSRVVVVTGSSRLDRDAFKVIPVLVVFFLVRREDLRDRFIRLVGRGQMTLTIQALEDAAMRVSRYLLMQLLINAVFGVLVAIGLYLIGVPNAVLWGIVATTLRFIPYIGPWIAAAMPMLACTRIG